MQKLLSNDNKEIRILLENVHDSDLAIADIFKCISCSLLVVNPKYCNCQDFYCKHCFSNCKICTQNSLPKDIGKIESKILKRVKIKCFHFNKGCSTFIEIGKYEEHLDKDCAYNYKCHNCSFISDFNKMIMHNRNCINKKENRKEEFLGNSTDKSMSTTKQNKANNYSSSPNFEYFEDIKDFFKDSKCINCEFIVTENQRKAHYLLCPKYRIKCYDCSTIIQKKNFPFHNDGRCFMKMILFYESNRKAGNFVEKIKSFETNKFENLKLNLTDQTLNTQHQMFLNRKRLKEREIRRSYLIEFDKQSDLAIEGQINNSDQ